LVPLVDRRVREFYGAGGKPNRFLLEQLHADYCSNLPELKKWCDGRLLPGGREMTPLRALDIVVWMEQEKRSHS
jgi:hypothetical protein